MEESNNKDMRMPQKFSPEKQKYDNQMLQNLEGMNNGIIFKPDESKQTEGWEIIANEFDELCSTLLGKGGFRRLNGTMDSYVQSIWLRKNLKKLLTSENSKTIERVKEHISGLKFHEKVKGQYFRYSNDGDGHNTDRFTATWHNNIIEEVCSLPILNNK